MLAGKKILIAITGSIAAYKMPVLTRLLIKEGCEVKVIMTPAAQDFVSRLTLSTLTKQLVLTDLFDEETWANHVMLGRWADVMLIAPLSCNTLGKMANGLCDNLVLATYLSATCPVVVAPAMDEDMWHHPSTKENLSRLQQHGCHVLPVGYGELASGLTGEGRMAEPEEMVRHLQQFFIASQKLAGKKVLITAGPTYESIDPVRFIGNHSSGKMGYALAEAFQRRGAFVQLVSGPVALKAPLGVNKTGVRSAEEMYKACMQHLDYDIAVMAAAVADYTVTQPEQEKIKKEGEELTLSLRRTKDILGSLGGQKKEGQLLVGFALETNNEETNALQKLQKKNADAIVLNSLQDDGAGFGHDTNQVTIYFKNGTRQKLPLQSKSEIAAQIVDALIELTA
jgi:phosphopantothenoylcysteine decarboxylase / phosphopantothenate---cysteine ligase